MTKELIDKLLESKTQEDFENILLNEKTDYMKDRSLWDDKVIEHLISISDITREEFEWAFTLTPPIDNFDD